MYCNHKPQIALKIRKRKTLVCRKCGKLIEEVESDKQRTIENILMTIYFWTAAIPMKKLINQIEVGNWWMKALMWLLGCVVLVFIMVFEAHLITEQLVVRYKEVE